jgi:hypothetical protein
VTAGRRLGAALEAAVSDPGAWPIGMLGFLVRGGLVVMALPILTLPTPVGLATLLGPAVISTGRLDGPLFSLLLVWGLALLAMLAVALVLAAGAQGMVHARWGRSASGRHPAALPRLAALELLAITPIGAVLAVTAATIVDGVRSELLLPADLAVPLLARVVTRAALSLGALVAAVLVAEAVDGSVSRRVLVQRRQRRAPWQALLSVVATAALGWSVTLVVLLPGLVLIGGTWEAVRVAWSSLPLSEPSSPDIALAMVAVVAMVAVWIGVLLLCGIASIVRAHLWTSRVAMAGDWTDVGN